MSAEVIDRSNVLNINVGILGHVDAGKTALVRSLSTSLSTAALDKNPQSQQRGITLDLGFSAFTLPIPSHLAADPASSAYDSIQFTLVDCPGHASLIRTIIGGAQIIDMILLVVDANKGIQTQTAECIVIGEITTDNMIVVLNKVDMIPEQERRTKLDRVTNRIRKVFSTTKFADAPIVYTAAAVGGEKSTGSAAAGSNSSVQQQKPVTQGIDDLVELIKAKVAIPNRNYAAPFYYAIDHCFSIKGHGTVLTGTVLSGSVSVNSVIELPLLQLQRKVKSLQMFRKPVKAARQGDRVGICVTNLDASLIERGIAAAPGSVPLLQSVLCLVKKVRFFRGACRSMTKFHISIGHNTVIASAVFFGRKQVSQGSPPAHGAAEGDAPETAVAGEGAGGKKPPGGDATLPHKQSALNAGYHRSFPDVVFQFYDDGSNSSSGGGGGDGSKQPASSALSAAHFGYEYQDEMASAEGMAYGSEPVQWALLQFQTPVYCPIGSLVIGSRLDADTTDRDLSSLSTAAAATSGSQQCRLAFYGPVKAALAGDEQLPRTGVYTWRTKECEVFLLTDQRRGGLCYEAVVWKLVTGGGSVAPFLGLKVETADKRHVGSIVSSYGADGKCRVKFPDGCRLAVKDKLLFRYKRYVFDRTKRMVQTGLDELRASENIPPLDSLALSEEAAGVADGFEDSDLAGPASGRRGKAGKRATRVEKDATSAASSTPAPADQNQPLHSVASTSPTAPAPAPAQAPDIVDSSGKEKWEASSEAQQQEPTTVQNGTNDRPALLAAEAGPEAKEATLPAPPPEGTTTRMGVLESSKLEEGTDAVIAIVKGAFRMEENVRQFTDCAARCGTGTGTGAGALEGRVVAPFGKLGKCKVRFPPGAVCEVGADVAIFVPAPAGNA